MTPHSFFLLVSVVLGLVLAIPPNTCIVIVNLESIRKKRKLSPSDVIFLAKAVVNVLLQCVMTLQVMLYIFHIEIFYTSDVYSSVKVPLHFLTYYGFWLIAWLSAHYCTSITNLSFGFFIWIKRVMSHSLGQVLVLTALGLVPVSALAIWAFNAKTNLQSENVTIGASSAQIRYTVTYSFYIPLTFLGCILPFFLSLLSLLLTGSFLVRHVWRVKNNDPGSTRPNLQAHVTALRTIFFLLLMFTSFSMSQVTLLIRKPQKYAEPLEVTTWTLKSLSPSAEAAVIFQASNKLRRILLRRFWMRRWRNSEI